MQTVCVMKFKVALQIVRQSNLSLQQTYLSKRASLLSPMSPASMTFFWLYPLTVKVLSRRAKASCCSLPLSFRVLISAASSVLLFSTKPTCQNSRVLCFKDHAEVYSDRHLFANESLIASVLALADASEEVSRGRKSSCDRAHGKAGKMLFEVCRYLIVNVYKCEM